MYLQIYHIFLTKYRVIHPALDDNPTSHFEKESPLKHFVKVSTAYHLPVIT